jgi:hypothetical protein
VGALFIALLTTSGATIATTGDSGAATGSSGLRAKAAAIAATITADDTSLAREGDRYLQLSGDYDTAMSAAAQAEIHIGALKHQVANDTGAIRSAAIAAYVGDGADGTAGLLIDGTPDNAATKSTYAQVATGDLTTSIAALHNHEIGLEQMLTLEEQDAAAARIALDETTTERNAALTTLGAEQQVLTSVNGEIATLAEQEAAAAAQRAAAHEQALEAAQAAAATAAAQAAAQTSATHGTTPPPTEKPIALSAGPPAPAGILAASPSPATPTSLQAEFAAIRACESGDDYLLNTGNGYYGAYQFSASTWAGLGGVGLASAAPPAVQDAAAYRLYQERGWSSWPSCAVITGVR